MQPTYPEYEEEYDDDTDELVIEQDFQSRSDWHKKEIDWYHRYYYKCANSCNYSLHQFCAELSKTLKHISHSEHTFILFQQEDDKWYCHICKKSHKHTKLSYHCFECDFNIDLNCAMAWVDSRIIYHPGHKHPLVAGLKPILCECNACGREH